MKNDPAARLWKRTLIVLIILVVVGFCAIATRLVWLQIVQGEELQKKAVGQQLADTTINAERGSILDCNGNLLAESSSVWTVVLEPGMAQDEELSFADYALDYDAEQYRVLTYVDGVPYSAQFRFESVEQGLEEALEE